MDFKQLSRIADAVKPKRTSKVKKTLSDSQYQDIVETWLNDNQIPWEYVDADVSKFLEDEGAVFVPKDQYFHSSGEMCDITLIGGEEDLKKYLEDFEE